MITVIEEWGDKCSVGTVGNEGGAVVQGDVMKGHQHAFCRLGAEVVILPAEGGRTSVQHGSFGSEQLSTGHGDVDAEVVDANAAIALGANPRTEGYGHMGSVEASRRDAAGSPAVGGGKRVDGDEGGRIGGVGHGSNHKNAIVV